MRQIHCKESTVAFKKNYAIYNLPLYNFFEKQLCAFFIPRKKRINNYSLSASKIQIKLINKK